MFTTDTRGVTVTDRTPALADVAAELDPDAIYADEMLTEAGDDLLRATAAAERTAKVHSAGRRTFGANQSHSARAWTGAGEVD